MGKRGPAGDEAGPERGSRAGHNVSLTRVDTATSIKAARGEPGVHSGVTVLFLAKRRARNNSSRSFLTCLHPRCIALSAGSAEVRVPATNYSEEGPSQAGPGG